MFSYTHVNPLFLILQAQNQHALTTREVMINNQPVHVQVLQGNTAQVIKYEINIPQESGQSIE